MSIEHINAAWHGQLHRHNIDGKRRIMVWASGLHQQTHSLQSFDEFKEVVLKTRLRVGIDYHIVPTRNDIRLTISAVQAILIMMNTDRSWHLHHELTDLIHRGFSTYGVQK